MSSEFTGQGVQNTGNLNVGGDINIQAGGNSNCLADLRITDPRHDKIRIEEVKGGLLEDSYCWIFDNVDFQQWRYQHNQLLWIKGDPGKGKTMLLCGIIDNLKKETGLLSYFFCQNGDSRINNGTAVLRGLVYLLIEQQPLLIRHVQEKYNHAGQKLFTDPNSWVALTEILMDILQDPSLERAILIIDALDECVQGRAQLLDFIITKSTISPRIKWIVSSRNWPEIEERLELAEDRVTLRLELNADSVSTAVGIYIQHKVLQLTKLKKYDKKIRAAVLDHLLSNANNTFLWVALVCQSLKKIPRWNTLAKLNAFPPGLDSLYNRMINQICASDSADLCKKILALVATVYRPVKLQEMTCLLETLKDMTDDIDSLKEIIGLCGSMLTIREDTVYLVHQSVKDYLLEMAFDEIFPSGKEDMHKTIFSLSLHVLSKKLKRDIYQLRALGCSIEEAKTPDPDPLAPLRYSCTYWIDHFCDCCTGEKVSSQGEDEIEAFLKTKYLYWLEALSLSKNMSQGVRSMTKLEALIQKGEGSFSAIELVSDARRFIMYHKQTIENSPLQTYVSALIFSPSGSLVRCLFMEEEPNWVSIKPAMSEKWSPCLQTLEGHTSVITSVAISRDMKWLASASRDKMIKIWDPYVGQCLQTFQSHNEIITSMVISHDSTWIASASHDGTIKIWEACNCRCLHTLTGHTKDVNSIAFSHDSAWLASCSFDNPIKIWDPIYGQCLRTIQVRDIFPLRQLITFSHDSAWLAVGSGTTIKILDPLYGQCLRTFEGHTGLVNSIVFSHDSIRLASASGDYTIKIWDTVNSTCLQSLRVDNSHVISVAFSHDSILLASGHSEGKIVIWNSYNGQHLQTFEGHGGCITSVSFSQNSKQLASSSYDATIKIWDICDSQYILPHECHNMPIKNVAISYDLRLFASVSWDNQVKIWDISSLKCFQTLDVRDFVKVVAFSHDSKWIALAGSLVRIWDITTKNTIQTLKGLGFELVSVVFSHDSTRLASASDWKIYIWDICSGNCLQKIVVGKEVRPMSFDPTGSYLHTGFGTISIDGSSSPHIKPIVLRPQNIQYQGWAISSDRMWMTYNSENLVYLPLEYRPATSTSWAVLGNVICAGAGSRNVWVYTFK